MIKIWGKLLSNDKIIKSNEIEIDETKTSFFDMLREMSAKLSIPTPVLLDKHVYDFNVFKICVFKPDDFVESVIFDRFVLEYLNRE